MAIFAVGTFLFILLFIGGTFLFFLAPKTIFDGDCMQSKTSWITDLGVMSVAAQGIFCQPPCQCNFTNNHNVYTDEEAGLLKNTNPMSTASNVMNCSIFNDLKFNEANILLMTAL